MGGDAASEIGTREAAVELPHDLWVNSYLMREHKIPDFAFGSEPVFHYTDSTGLIGIINKKRFWASNSAFLNDPSEGTYVLKFAARWLSQREFNEAREATFVERLLPLLDVRRDVQLFIVSFCREGDLLSQWRGYGAFGRGYALGFDSGQLRPQAQYGWLIRVTYDEEKLVNVLNDLLEIHFEHFDRKLVDMNEQVQLCAAQINFIAEAFKHPSYKEEQEVRLMFKRGYEPAEQENKWYGTAVKYRARGGDILPYIETPLTFPDFPDFSEKLPLRSVVIGPGIPFEKNQRSVLGLLEAHSFKGVEVRPSTVPFVP